MALGDVVREWRLARGWEQKDLVARSRPRVLQATVSMIEAGRVPRPSGKTLVGLATAFGVSVDQLLAAAGGVEMAPEEPGPALVELPEGLDPAWVADFLRYGGRLTDAQRRLLLRMAHELARQPAAEVPPEPGEQAPGDQRLRRAGT